MVKRPQVGLRNALPRYKSEALLRRKVHQKSCERSPQHFPQKKTFPASASCSAQMCELSPPPSPPQPSGPQLRCFAMNEVHASQRKSKARKRESSEAGNGSTHASLPRLFQAPTTQAAKIRVASVTGAMFDNVVCNREPHATTFPPPRAQLPS